MRRESLRTQAGQSGVAPHIRNDVLPNLQLVRIAINVLKVPGRKTRKHSQEQLREIIWANSTLGFCAPILVDKCNVVIEGEAYVAAARQMGLGEVPCILIGHLNEGERRSLRLAINRLGEKSE